MRSFLTFLRGRRVELLLLLMLFLFSVGIRLLWCKANISDPISDYRSYYRGAVDTVASGRPAAHAIYKGPGTVLILALWMKLFGASLAGILVLNSVLGGLTVVATYCLAKALTDRRDVSAVVAILAAIYPEFLNTAALVASENFALLALVLSAIAVVHLFRWQSKWPVFLTGVFLGYASLIRTLLLPALPLLFLGFYLTPGRKPPIVVNGEKVTRSTVFALGVCLAILPWSAYATLRLRGRPVLISKYAPMVFYCSHNPLTQQGWKPGLDLRSQIIPDYAEGAGSYDQEMSYALRYCLQHPQHILQNFTLHWKGLFRQNQIMAHWVGKQKAQMYRTSADRRTLPFDDFGGSYRLTAVYRWIFRLCYWGGLLQVLLLLLRGKPERSHWLLFFAFSLVFVNCVLAFGESRFLIPWMPFFMILGAMLTVDVYCRFVKDSVFLRYMSEYRWFLTGGALLLFGLVAVGRLLTQETVVSVPLVRHTASDLALDWSKRGTKETPALVAQDKGPKMVGFEVTVPQAGDYEVQVRYFGDRQYGMGGSINGSPLPETIFDPTFRAELRSQAWGLLGVGRFREGANSLVVRTSTSSPVITGVRLVPADAASLQRVPLSSRVDAEELARLKSLGSMLSGRAPLPEHVYSIGEWNTVEQQGVRFDGSRYGKPNRVMVTPREMDNYHITFRVHVKEAGSYAVYTKYSSVEKRPVSLGVDGKPSIIVCEERTSHSWQNADSVLVLESEEVELDKGDNTIQLSSWSVFPHIEKVYFLRVQIKQ
jgi:4-amino-4-deoxy-L-arabinose transferase-like glycosyltransferase